MNKLISIIKALIFFCFCSIIFAQELIIKNIKIEGNVRLTDKDILRNARLYNNMTLKGPEIQQAIKRLWKLERFKNIQLMIDNESEDGLYIRIIIEELPILGDIEFEGNKKISKRTLLDEIELQSGQTLSENVIFEAIQKIKELYSEKHYHNIKIDTIFSTDTQKHVKNLKFLLNIGHKAKIKTISFNGNNIFSDQKLSKQFKENKAKKWFLPWGGTWKKNNLQDDKNLIIQFYKNQGYKDFYFINENISLRKNKKGYDISFDIYEGPQYKIRNITWNGNYIFSDEELLHRLNFNSGDIFKENEFNISLSEKVTPLYSDRGYFYFQINPIYKPVDVDSLDINFEIIENQIVHVRRININGNNKTYENVIRRELRVFPGDIFSRQKLMDSYRDVFMLNYFENVIPDVVPISDNEIDIQLDVIEKNTGQANLSMGYNGVYGFTGGGGFEFPNFLGRGQTVSISYQRGLNANTASNQNNYLTPTNYGSQNSTAYQTFSLSFTEPWLFDTPNLVGGSYFYTSRGQGQGNYLPFDNEQHGGSLRWGRRFKWPDYFFRGSWMFRGATNKYISEDKSALISYFDLNENDINYEDNSYIFSSAGISFIQTITRDSRNHPEFPTKGSKSIWTSTFSGSFLGGNQNYHKHVLDFNYFTPIYKKFTISQIFKIGILNKISSNNNKRSIIPPSARFIMGGTGIPYGEMLRGYTENRVGPFSSIRGGNIMMKYSLEFRLSISENPTIYTLSFFEMGNVWGDINSLDPFNLKRSAGIGVRIFIPMLGMLGYDIGYGFDYTEYDNYLNNGLKEPHGWEYHLIFGMPF